MTSEESCPYCDETQDVDAYRGGICCRCEMWVLPCGVCPYNTATGGCNYNKSTGNCNMFKRDKDYTPVPRLTEAEFYFVMEGT